MTFQYTNEHEHKARMGPNWFLQVDASSDAFEDIVWRWIERDHTPL